MDLVAKAVARGATRREALRLLAGGALGGLLGALGLEEAAAACFGRACGETTPCCAGTVCGPFGSCCRKAGGRCTKDRQCCSGTCRAGGTCKCTATSCPKPANPCKRAVCTADGRCGVGFVATGTPLADQIAGDCQRRECDGTGGIRSVPDDTDLPDDGNPCTDDVCTAGVPSNPNKADGVACGTGKICASGTCVTGQGICAAAADNCGASGTRPPRCDNGTGRCTCELYQGATRCVALRSGACAPCTDAGCVSQYGPGSFCVNRSPNCGCPSGQGYCVAPCPNPAT